MAMAYTKDGYSVWGDKRVTWGTYTDDGTNGGDINTGLKRVDVMFLQPTGNAVETNAPSINETLPGADGTAVTIVVDSASTGVWLAIGR